MIKYKKYIAFNQKVQIDQFIKLKKIMRRDKNMKSKMTFINNHKNQFKIINQINMKLKKKNHLTGLINKKKN